MLSIIIWMVAAAMLLMVVNVIYAYNHLVKLNNLVKEGWSGIDIHLKQRAKLL